MSCRQPTDAARRLVAERGLWAARLFYLAYYAATAALLPFLPLYYQSRGLQGSRIGLLAAVPPVLAVVGGTLWGALADSSHRHRLVLMLAVGGSGVSALLVARAGTFAWLVPAVIGLAAFLAPIPSLADHAVLQLLGERGDRYGRVRLWGAVGWGVSAPLAGLLVERTNLTSAFGLFTFLMLVLLLATAALPMATRPAGGRRNSLGALLRRPGWTYFLLVAFVGGSSLGFAHHYLFLYMDAVGVDPTSMGMALSAATLSELAFFYWTDRLIRRWGVLRLLLLGTALGGVRLLLYAVTEAPWLILAIQLLHGPAFAMMWAAGVTAAHRLAPPGAGATAQGAFAGVNFGLAGGAGALIGGVLLDHMHPQEMYAWAGGGVLVLVALLRGAGRRQAARLGLA